MFDFDDLEEQEGPAPTEEAKAQLPRLPESVPGPKLPLPALLQSKWIWMAEPNEDANIRLFCFTGLGMIASTFVEWVSKEAHQTYPAVEVCMVELPGQGQHGGAAPFYDVPACGEACAKEIWRVHFSADQKSKRPFALYGFSMGAKVAHEVARQLQGPKGETCEKLYVAGRGGPHLQPPYTLGMMTPPTTVEGMTEEDILELIMSHFRALVPPDQCAKYERFMKLKGEATVHRRASVCGDIAMSTLNQILSNTRALEVSCPLQHFSGTKDTIWPPGGFDGMYDDLADTWRMYALDGRFDSKVIDDIDHNELGSAKSPVRSLIMEDLTQLVEDPARFTIL